MPAFLLDCGPTWTTGFLNLGFSCAVAHIAETYRREEALGVLLNHLPLRRESRINPGLINPSKGVSRDAQRRVSAEIKRD
jgi:hypothetical protein